ncbi:hypothetical protein [Longimicrobium sp.]|jgi:hypothetical protein|uniref:hypothetical protein n=1 Tax=Longimicrobium sp. TaxID=2029185 RepID=UPI002ED8C0DA
MKTLLAATILAISLAAPASAAAQLSRGMAADPDMTVVRTATEKYRDVNVALAEGYVRDPMNLCDTAEMMGRPAEYGVMGIHYFRPDLLGITGPPNPRVSGTGTHTDFSQPSILIYEPQADGSLDLVAVENLVFIKAWEAAGNTAPPTFAGRSFDRMQDDPATALDEAHMFEPHYDLHVWLYRENPRGVFAQFNPNATCQHHQGGSHAH